MARSGPWGGYLTRRKARGHRAFLLAAAVAALGKNRRGRGAGAAVRLALAVSLVSALFLSRRSRRAECPDGYHGASVAPDRASRTYVMEDVHPARHRSRT